ncbi:MAG: response regulator transcription factor [Cyanobacteria bacterium P01_A01_bin.135]
MPLAEHPRLGETPVSTLVIAQDRSLMEHLVEHLNLCGYLVSGLTDASEALQRLQQQTIDITLIHWTSSDSYGLALCRQARRVNDQTYIVLVVPEVAGRGRRIEALDAGADDCLPHPLDLGELDARIRAYCRRIRRVERDVYQFSDLTLNSRTREVYRGDSPITLTAKEFDLLRYLIRHPQQVLTRHQILEQVWGYDFTGDSNIIEVYVRYLRLKLETQDRSRLIHTVRYVGYVLREPSNR